MCKSTQKPVKVAITATESNNNFTNITTLQAPYTTVISGEDRYVYLVKNEQEVKTLEQLNQWEDTLPSIGLRMKTGLIVDLRSCTDRLKSFQQSAKSSNGTNCLSRTDRYFIIFGKAAGVVEPRQRTLNDPPLWQDLPFRLDTR